MRRCVLASAFLLAITFAASAGDADRRSLYSPPFGFFSAETKAELKVTPEQWKSIQASDDKRGEIWKRHVAETVKLSRQKLPQKEDDAKHRALETQVVDELYKTYGESLSAEQIKRMKQINLQVRGMEVFDHAEVRTAMKLTDKDVKSLRSAYDAAARELKTKLDADLKAKTITNKQAAKTASNFTFSVPDKVRELLNRDQRRILDDLLGETFVYK